MRTTLDILREHTGVADGPSVVDALRRADQASVDALAERLLAAPPAPRRTVAPNEVWPLVNARASLLSRGAQGFVDGIGPAGLSVSAAMNPRELGRGTFSTGVLRALLYSHGLVIEDPALLAAELHVGSPAQTRSLSRRFIESATVSLFEVGALIDSGVIETFFVRTADRADDGVTASSMVEALATTDRGTLWDAFEAGYVDGLSPSLRRLWKAIRAGDRSPSLDLVEEALTETDREVVKIFVEVVASLRPDAVIDNTVSIVASAVADHRRLGGRHDILCASELFARLLFVGRPDPAAELRVRQLARTPVPNIADLDVLDVVEMRRQSEAFATWRARLSIGLERAHRLRDELGPEVDLAAAVDEVLADARDELDREARRSAVLGQGGWVSFVAGALGGATAGAVSGLGAAVTGAAGALLGEGVKRALERETSADAVRRHYVVFRSMRAG